MDGAMNNDFSFPLPRFNNHEGARSWVVHYEPKSWPAIGYIAWGTAVPFYADTCRPGKAMQILKDRRIRFSYRRHFGIKRWWQI